MDIDVEISKFPKPKQTYKVFIECNTYNHSNYIENTFDGFVAQQTDFHYVCFIIDDSSTDCEQEVINAYLNKNFDLKNASTFENELATIIEVTHNTNKFCHFIVTLLKKNLYGTGKKDIIRQPWIDSSEYEAFCEGDDYWTDPLKLKKQVEIMETNHNIGFVYSAFSTIQEDGQSKEFPWCEERMVRSHSGDLLATLLDHNNILTLTVCTRKSLYDIYLKSSKDRSLAIDYYCYLILAGYSNGYYLTEKTGTYRINSNGMCQSNREYVNLKCDKAAIKASLLYLDGNFNKRNYFEDLKIKSAIISKIHSVYKRGLLGAEECKQVIKRHPIILLYTPFAIIMKLYAKLTK